MSETFLKITGLKKYFGDAKVLDGVDLQIERGRVTTVVGKSGTGKSVLLKCIADIIQADAGTIELNGQPILKSRRRSKQSGVSFSYMFQNNALFDSLTALENVALPLLEAGQLKHGEIREKVVEMLDQLDLAGSVDRYPGELSGGMQKRVAFARALITDPELVLFDEPTTGLDPERKFGIFDLIAEYREKYGFTAVLVSHDIPEVFDISDHVAWLDAGTVKFFGEPEALLESSQEEVVEFLNKAKFSPTEARISKQRVVL
jgi:phospholipid/cholesterol/gamma-HCH transport system ATP-binding protein